MGVKNVDGCLVSPRFLFFFGSERKFLSVVQTTSIFSFLSVNGCVHHVFREKTVGVRFYYRNNAFMEFEPKEEDE